MARYTITIEPGALTNADDYASLPDKPGWRAELTDGKVIYMPTVKDHAHGWIIDNLARRLSPYIHDHQLGRLTFSQEGYDITSPDAEGDTIWAPDLAFVSTEHLPIVREARVQKKYVKLAPDLAVEIASPSQSKAEMAERVQRWLAAGTRLMWVVWPQAQTVDVWQPDEPMHTLTTQEALDGREVVPDFTMPVADLFAF